MSNKQRDHVKALPLRSCLMHITATFIMRYFFTENNKYCVFSRVKKEFEEVAGAASLPEPTKDGATAEVSKSSNISTPETSFKTLSTSSTSAAAAKYENFRKLSQSLTQEDEFDDDEYTPNFQRVYITGEDNTGVSR